MDEVKGTDQVKKNVVKKNFVVFKRNLPGYLKEDGLVFAPNKNFKQQ